MKRLVTTTHLEMTDPAQHRRPATPDADGAPALAVVRAEIPSPALNRFLYTAVGAAWCWFGRLPWDHERWMRYLDRPELETWIGSRAGTPAGYFELERQPDSAVEIVYFGLMPGFIGQGLGGRLLSAAIDRGWEMLGGAGRIWVHTCDLDHPQALANYQARGFRVFAVEQRQEDLPDAPLEPWPGANIRHP
jgi:GNAT superfamily N-acetyltransferase